MWPNTGRGRTVPVTVFDLVSPSALLVEGGDDIECRFAV